jgi:hypothetical protein
MPCPPHPLSSDNPDNGQGHLYFNKNVNALMFHEITDIRNCITFAMYCKLMTLIHECKTARN